MTLQSGQRSEVGSRVLLVSILLINKKIIMKSKKVQML